MKTLNSRFYYYYFGKDFLKKLISTGISMEEFHVANGVNHTKRWLVLNHETILTHVVNFSISIIILIIGIFLGKIIANGIHKILLVKKIDNTTSGFIATSIKYVVIVLTFIIILGQMGCQTNSILTVLGTAGMAIGLALQNSLSNFAAGVLLVTLRPIRTGEYVNIGIAAGTVLNIQIFYTTLRSVDGKIIIIPNGKIITENIINYSRESIRRNEFIIKVAHNSDVDSVIRILQEVIASEKRVIQHLSNVVNLSELTASSINFKIRCWSYTKDLNSVYCDLMLQFKRALDRNNISLPIKRREIYLHKKNKKKKFR